MINLRLRVVIRNFYIVLESLRLVYFVDEACLNLLRRLSSDEFSFRKPNAYQPLETQKLAEL